MLTEERKRALFQELYLALEEELFRLQLKLAACRGGDGAALIKYTDDIAGAQRALDNLATTYPEYLIASGSDDLDHPVDTDDTLYQLTRIS